LKKELQPVKPIYRELGVSKIYRKGDDGLEYLVKESKAVMAEWDIHEHVNKIMTECPWAMAEMMKSSEEYCKGVPAEEPEVIEDYHHGLNWRTHPKLKQPALPMVVRIVIVLEQDEVDVVNPTDIAAGKHKVHNFIGKIVNLPPDVRNSYKYKFPIAIAYDKHVKEFGATKVLAGADDDGEPLANADMAFCRQMQRWYARSRLPLLPLARENLTPPLVTPSRRYDGQLRSLPIGPHGEPHSRVVEYFFIDMTGDMLGNGKMSPCSMSASAHKFCRECYYDQRKPNEIAAFRDINVRTLLPLPHRHTA